MELLLKKCGGMYAPFGDESKAAFKKIPLGTIMRCELKNESTGTIPMLRTWRGWMGQTAQHMAAAGCFMPLYIDSQGVARGRRAFNGDDCHDLFTSRWLGVDEQGRRYSWSMSSNPELIVAPKFLRLHAMNLHLEWSTERGIKLTIPRNSEFQKLQEAQEK